MKNLEDKNPSIERRVFPLRIFLPWQLVMLFFAGAGLGTGIFTMALKVDFLRPWLEVHVVGTSLMVIVIALVFVYARRLFSVQADFIVDRNVLEIVFEKSNYPVYFRDEYIHWNSIVEWAGGHSHVSADSIAPAEFVIKLANRRKIRFFIADESKIYKNFLMYFELKIREVNIKNQALEKVTKLTDSKYDRTSFVVLISIALFCIILGGVSFFTPDIYNAFGGNWDALFIFLTIGVLLLTVALIGRKNGKANEKRNNKF